MDAKAIYEHFRAHRGRLSAFMQEGAGLTDVDIRRVTPSTMTLIGTYVPERATRVMIRVDDLTVEGTVTSIKGFQYSIDFIRPVPPRSRA